MSLEVKYTDKKCMDYFCKNFHYSKCSPSGKLIKHVVIYNNEIFGVIVYGKGNPNASNRFGLTQYNCIELARIALKKHPDFFVSEVISKSLKSIKEDFPDIKIVYSYADIQQNHLGKIYQATNWIYERRTTKTMIFHINSKKIHQKTVNDKIKLNRLRVKDGDNREIIDKIKQLYKTENVKISYDKGKHCYLMPMNKKIRKKIIKLNQEYPNELEEEEMNGEER